MKHAWLLLALGGCEVVFPLKDESAPDVALQVPALVVGAAPTEVAIIAMGRPDETVFYELVAGEGTVDPDRGSFALDGSGMASELVSWTPPDDYKSITLDVSCAYEETFARSDSDHLDVAVGKRFGPGGLDRELGMPGPNKILASTVQIGSAPGTIARIEVTVKSASAVVGALGIYQDDDGRPGTLVETAMFEVIADKVLEVDVSLDVSPGTYWLAVIVDGPADIEAETSGGPAVVADLSPPSLQMPVPFPTVTTAINGEVGLRAIVLP